MHHSTGLWMLSNSVTASNCRGNWLAVTELPRESLPIRIKQSEMNESLSPNYPANLRDQTIGPPKWGQQRISHLSAPDQIIHSRKFVAVPISH